MSLWSNTDAQASKPKNLGLGQVQRINVIAGGSAYTPTNGTASATIAAPPAGGVQATATITITAGVITSVAVVNPGAGYTTAPSVTYTTGGTGANMASVIKAVSGNGPVNSEIVFVSAEEAAISSNRLKGLKTPGWNRYREWSNNAGEPRYAVDVLVAMTVANATSGDAADDTIVGDAVYAIGTQPVAVSVTAPAVASFTVVAPTPSAYQWQLRTPAGSGYTNISNGGVYTNATTATLNISNSTGLNGNRYRCVVLNSAGTASATSRGALLTVA